MAQRYGTCNCGRGLAMVRATMFGRATEVCQRCVDDYEAERRDYMDDIALERGRSELREREAEAERIQRRLEAEEEWRRGGEPA